MTYTTKNRNFSNGVLQKPLLALYLSKKTLVTWHQHIDIKANKIIGRFLSQQNRNIANNSNGCYTSMVT
jgi:hypothetical protein